MSSYDKCKKHERRHCATCPSDSSDNVGDVTINTEGNLSIGIGSGLAIDPTDGSIGFKVGGITIDTQ